MRLLAISRLGPLGLLLFALLLSNVSAAATRVWVANNGVDSPSCGAASNPCRSISQGIENAQSGDTIYVGPGHYGNVSGSADYSGPGDERPQTFVNDSEGCLVCITKSLHIYSVSGASVTVIAGSPPPQGSGISMANVAILQDGVAFGSAGHGFTLTGGSSVGLEIDYQTMEDVSSVGPSRNISVSGNVDIGDGSGFVFSGRTETTQECPTSSPVCAPTAQLLFSDNESYGNGGFSYSATANMDLGPGQVLFENNLAMGSGGGFQIQTGFQCKTCEVAIRASNIQWRNNVATNSGIGFYANMPGEISGNTAAYNSQAGFQVTPGPPSLFQHNSAIGNSGPGVIIQWSPDAFTEFGGSFQTFSQNNFFGNDRNRPTLALHTGDGGGGHGPYNPGPSAHCGVLNVGALADIIGGPAGTPPPRAPLAANYDYWGSAAGPKATGAGDAIGGACDQNNAVTTARFPAATAYPVTTAP
ncbi:MAG TPA: hypothetical protein VFB37_01580 [Steroidobacteraceae bacterium]|nr:hypothetical protein [Steroidobacteraceae bacterium]